MLVGCQLSTVVRVIPCDPQQALYLVYAPVLSSVPSVQQFAAHALGVPSVAALRLPRQEVVVNGQPTGVTAAHPRLFAPELGRGGDSATSAPSGGNGETKGVVAYSDAFVLNDRATVLLAGRPVHGDVLLLPPLYWQRSSHLYQLMRPEVVLSWKQPLCPDAFCNWGREGLDAHNTELVDATLHVISKLASACRVRVVLLCCCAVCVLLCYCVCVCV